MSTITVRMSVADLPRDAFDNDVNEAKNWLETNGGSIEQSMIDAAHDAIDMYLDIDGLESTDKDDCFDREEDPFQVCDDDIKLLVAYVMHQPLSTQQKRKLATALDGHAQGDISAHGWALRRKAVKDAFTNVFGFFPDNKDTA